MASNMRSIIEEEKKKIEQENAKEQMEARKQQFDQSVLELADRALEAQQTRGLEDPITELLVNFLEVAIEMQDTMQTLATINSAMECITGAIEFLDNALVVDQAMMEGTLSHKYGFFARLKQRRLTQRVVRNNKNRMKQIMGNLQMKMEMAQSMVTIMKEFSLSLKKANSKKKKKAAGAAPAAPSRAAAFLAERAREKGVNVNAAPTATETKVDTDSDTAGATGGVDIFPHSN